MAEAKHKPTAETGGDARSERFIAIRKLLDSDIRPYVQADGGDIELIAVDGNKVKVRLHGACTSCPSSLQTLYQGVETRLKAMIAPDLVVEAVP